MLKKKFYLSLILTSSLFIACSSDDSDNDIEEGNEENVDTNEGTGEGEEIEGASTTFLITEDLLNSDSLISYEIVEAELENGITADCYQLVFSSNPDNIETGPYCPTTIDETAGMSFYDGATGAGLRVWEKSLLDDIEADGYDIVDEDGTVHINDFNGSDDGDPDTYSYCLDGADNDSIIITYLIPVTPILADQVNEIEEIELVGVSVDGVPINGDPPSAINGPEGGVPGRSNNQTTEEITVVSIPSLDPCGGHNDPAGYYHWHMIPEVVNQVLINNGITQIECTNIEQTTNKVLSGFAKDGFPIYAYAVEPEGLDECGGIEAVTDEYPKGVYHYVASTTIAPNVPQCLVGVAARNAYNPQ